MGRRRFIWLFLGLMIVFPFELSGQTFDTFCSYSRLSVNRVLFHPGLTLNIREKYLDVYYSRPYGIKELETCNGFFIFPWKRTSNGISVMKFGKGVYSEIESSFLNTYMISDNLGFCSDLRMLMVEIKGYENLNCMSYSGGVCLAGDHGILGIMVRNIFLGGARDLENRIRGIQIIGNTSLSENVSIIMGILKERQRKTSISFEGRLRIFRDLIIGSGYGINPGEYLMGLELLKNDMGFTYYYRHNSELGGTFELGISIIL